MTAFLSIPIPRAIGKGASPLVREGGSYRARQYTQRDRLERSAGLFRLKEEPCFKRIPLEICLLSNVHTGAAASLAEHPFKIFYQEKFRVTLNTDNRLMSNTTMTKGFEAAPGDLWFVAR